MVIECGDGAVSAGQTEVFVNGLQGTENLTYRFTKGIAAIHYADGVCQVVIWQQRVSLDGQPPVNEAMEAYLITPADLLRSARYATDFVLSLARARIIHAFEIVSKLVN